MKYAVRALAPDHSIAELQIEALDEADARRQVQARGFHAGDVRLQMSGLAGLGTNLTGRRHVRWPLVLFSQELLSLLRAGLGIVESLEALLEKESAPASREVLSDLVRALHEGRRFSAALAAQPALFPPLYVGIVRAAEGTSDLPRALERYIDYQQRLELVRAKVTSAAIYPAILLGVGGAVCLFLVGYVVPRFAKVYEGAGRELPWMSALLLQWGAFADEHGGWLLAGLTGLSALAVVTVRRLKRQGGVAVLLKAIPGLRERVHIYELSRMYLTLGMLLEGGIPLVQAMTTVEDVVAPAMKQSLSLARTRIEDGMSLSTAFQAQGLTTPISLRLLAVGERSGSLGDMLTQSAGFYDGEITRWIDRFMRSFEPMLMTGIGLIVGVIVILLYMPIFDLAGNF